jgi:molecular chaperone DnaK
MNDNHPGKLSELEQKLVNILIEKFQKKENINLRGDKLAMERIFRIVQKLSPGFSEKKEILFQLPFITADKYGPKHLKEVIKLEDIGF